jgi:hypothetical protein
MHRKRLQNTLNDPGRLGIIYKGLTNHILAKYGGPQLLPLLNKEACLHSPTARILYLLKHNGLAHIQTDNITFLHNPKYLHQLLLLNITILDQITLPNKTTIMNEKEFQKYHKKPTPTIKKALKIESHLFFTTNCTNECNPPYNIHIELYTLAPEIINQLNKIFFHNPLPKNNPQTNIQERPKPPKQMQKLQNYSITTITDIKQSK